MTVRSWYLTLFGIVALGTGRATAEPALSWIDCYEAGGAAVQFFACDTNDGADELVVTFTPGESLGVINRVSFSVFIIAEGDTFPDWWRIGFLGRRQVEVLTSFDDPPFDDAICQDPWRGSFMGSATLEPDPEGCTTCGRTVIEIEGPSAEPLRKGQGYYICRLRLRHRNATGTGAIPGCAVAVCLQVSDFTFVLADGSVSRSYGSYPAGWQKTRCGP